MAKRFQLNGWLVATLAALCLSGAACGGALAQQKPSQSHPDRPPQAQQSHPQNPQVAHPDRPPQRPNVYSPNRDGNRPPAANAGAPRGNNFNPGTAPGARLAPRQQIGVGAARPFVDQMRDLTPQQRDRVLQNSRVFQNLSPEQQTRIRNQFNQWDRMSPQQRVDLRAKEETWRHLTPEQREHIKNDVLPQWRQLPWGRQQVIQQKLGILQNMPESARNRRLADPNFTRGMSDEDKTMLHDLSHLHVGGPPDAPGND